MNRPAEIESTAGAPISTPTALERRVRAGVAAVTTDDGARWAFRVAVLGAVVLFFIVGRNQWFTRDDWASVITRETVRETKGWQHWLFDPQDGHWLTVPFLIFAAVRRLFGLDSYWPFVLPAMAAHFGAVFLVRAICRRHNVSAWATTLVCSLLLVFGSGYENLIFAIQICFNLSLVVFVAQFVLVDHDGPVDRRDVLGSGLAVIGMMSSGFGPVFMAGIFIFLALRQRWKALLVAVVPQALAYGWWLVTWSSDNAANLRPANRSQLPAFVVRGISSTFETLTSLPGLAGLAVLATVVVSVQAGSGRRTQSAMLALCATVVVMFSAIGFQRLGFGVAFASSSRYLHLAAMVVAPAFAVAIDRLGRLGREARLASLLVVAVAGAVNASALRENSTNWALQSAAERETLELIAGSELARTVDQKFFPFVTSPDLTIETLAWLVEQGAFTPRQPVNEAEIERVRTALGLSPPP